MKGSVRTEIGEGGPLGPSKPAEHKDDVQVVHTAGKRSSSWLPRNVKSRVRSTDRRAGTEGLEVTIGRYDIHIASASQHIQYFPRSPGIGNPYYALLYAFII